jgi:ribosome-associated toxin RatA of RatAB toxin-antitoxin module
MTVIHKSTLVPYSAEQMYDLVNDVEPYPKFLPWCAEVQLLSKNRERLVATIVVSKGALKQAFTTMNAMEEGQRIEMNLVEGPLITNRFPEIDLLKNKTGVFGRLRPLEYITQVATYTAIHEIL